MAVVPGATGRPRDEDIDRAILEVAVDLLRSEGVEALSVARVAMAAGTTRPAVYRRYGSLTELAVAAVGAMAESTRPASTGDHLADLEAELTAFRDAITQARSISLVGSMLVDTVDPAVRQRYRETVVRPRRRRIRGILAAARDAGEITGDDRDLDIVTTMCTGSFYATALAGVSPPRDWPTRTARLVWRATGGTTAC